jgi:hypothetical protein
MKALITLTAITCLFIGQVYGQVGIGTTSPDASSVLDITATDKGILIPRVSLDNVNTTQLDGVNTAAPGLLIWNTNATTVGGSGIGFYYFDGAALWVALGGGAVDADWFEQGTTNPPNAITDNIFTTGAVGINTFATGSSQLNVAAGDFASNAGLFTNISSSAGGKIGIRTSVSSNTNASKYGLYNSLGSIDNSGVLYGTYNRIFGANNEIRYGMYNDFSGSGAGSNYGVYSNMNPSATGDIWGAYNNIINDQAGDKVGVQNTLTGAGGSKYGIYNEITENGTLPSYGSFNSMEGTGNGFQAGVHNIMFNQGNGRHEGVYNGLGGNGTGNHYGMRSIIGGTGIGIQIGVQNQIENTGTGEHAGVRNFLSGTGTGLQRGIYTEITNTGNGVHDGMFNYISGSGTSLQRGVVNYIDNSGSGEHQGTINHLVGSGSNLQTGTLNIIENSGDNTHWGVRNFINNPGNGDHIGTQNDVGQIGTGMHIGVRNYISGAGTGAQYGMFSELTNTAASVHYGIYNNLEPTGDQIFGTYNNLEGTVTNTMTGHFNNFISPSGSHTGYQNQFISGTNTQRGLYSIFTSPSGNLLGTETFYNSPSNGTHTGHLVDFRAASSGVANKYGFRVDVDLAAAGTLYGFYATVPQATGFAAYLDGNVLINDTGEARDVRIETDSRTHALFTDGANNVLRIGTIAGAVENNGVSVSGVTLDYVADFDNGSGTTAIGIGSAEYLLDAGGYITRIQASLVPGVDDMRDLGSATLRWNDVYATNGTIQTSDIRDKTDIKETLYGLKEVLRLRPISYQWKNKKLGEGKKLGFSAQELLTVIPEVVKTHDLIFSEETGTSTLKENERLGVYYSDLIPVLTKAIQEQQELIETLTKRIEKLEGKN